MTGNSDNELKTKTNQTTQVETIQTSPEVDLVSIAFLNQSKKSQAGEPISI